MQIVGINLISEGSGTAGFTVEYVEASGSVVSIRLAPSLATVNRTNAVEFAKRMLEELVQTNALPNQIRDGKNQDGRAATIAADVSSSGNNSS
jgi:hypothetical protein